MNFQAPNNTLEWMVFLARKYSNMFIDGTWLTLYIAVIGTIFGFLLGYLIGIIEDIRINPGDGVVRTVFIRLVKGIFGAYVEVFRDTPMIVQAMIVYYGIRQFGPEITPVAAGILVTVLNTGAYMAETVRAGIGSIDQGQREGAWAMGMSPSVLNVIAVQEQFMAAKTVGGNYYKYFESYLVIAVIYFVLCFLFNKVFILLEKKMQGKTDYALAVEYMDNF